MRVDALEYQRLTTVPPANLANLKPGAHIAVPMKDRRLQNVKIIRVEGDNIIVKLPNGNTDIFSKQDAYQPITRYRQILYIDERGLPLLGNSESIPIVLRPRKRLQTGGSDFSRPIKEDALINIDNSLRKARALYRSGVQQSEEFSQVNNDIVRKMQREMQKQGISTSLIY